MTTRHRNGSRALVTLLTSAVIACAAPQQAPDAVDGAAGSPPTVAQSDHSQAAGESIYALDVALVDQAGRRLRLPDLRGRPMVAAMIYTTCTSVCPRVTEDMKTIERQLGPDDRRGVAFALFSLDPGRDTPAALTRFAGEHGLDLERWTLMAATEDGVRDLAAVLGVRYRTEASGDIAHSATIVVIDSDGVVRHRQEGLSANQDELLQALRRSRP